jgi:predicted lipoprotein with Yx(FWY)xxD motif
VIRASRAAYLVCGVLTALALAGWGVRAAGTPRSDVARNSSVPVANAPQANNGDNQAANNGDNQGAVNGNTGTQDDVLNGGQQQAPPVQAAGNVTNTLSKKTLEKMGTVVVGDNGMTLYRFDKDAVDPKTPTKGSGKSTCAGDCAKLWPPLLAQPGQKPQLDGVDDSLVSTFKREDGGEQIMINNWPLYSYIGDTEAGTWKGQRVGDTWFVSDEKGKKNITCLPKAPVKPVPLPSDNKGGAAGGDNSGNNQGGGSNSGGGYSY